MTTGSHHVGELLTADDTTRAGWVERHRPAAVDDVANWWLHVLLVITHQTREDPARRAGWVGLHLWAVRHAVAAGALDAQDAARRTATYVTAVRELGPVDDLVDVLPSADSVVADCLRHLPAEVPTDGDPRPPRRVKVLVAGAAPHLEHVRDPGLAARLGAWVAAVPGR